LYLLFAYWITKLLYLGIAYPWIAPALFYLQNLNSLAKGLGKVSLSQIINFHPIYVTFTVPLVTIFTKFDGQIVAEYGKLGDFMQGKDKWDEARANAEDAFQQIYLPRVLNTKYPPKAYVRLEGEQMECLSVQK
jgi:hypothetical protein